MPSDALASAGKSAGSAVATAAADQAAAAATVAPEQNQVVSQQGEDTSGCAASYAADDWDWQQSQYQANLGFQDAFEASQGLGASPDLTPEVTWSGSKPAAPPAGMSGLLVKAARQPQALAKPSTAKHVPFSNRRIALPTSKPEMKQRLAATVQLPDPEFLSVRRPLPKQQPALSPQGTAPTSSHGAEAVPDAHLLGKQSLHAASASRQLRNPLSAAHAQAVSVCASRPMPPDLNCSLRHEATAASTDGASPDTATNVARHTGPDVAGRLVSDVDTFNTAGLQPQRAYTQVTKANSSHDCITAAASRRTTRPDESTDAAASGRSPSPLAAATSPAAAIFGPHIAGRVCSQSNAKKKLCLRLAPRQPEPEAAAGSTAAVVATSSPLQADRIPRGQLQPPAQHDFGAAAAAAADVDLAQSSSTHQQSRVGKGQLDGMGDRSCDGRDKDQGKDEAACKEAEEPVAATVVLSSMGNSLALASPEAATPAGQCITT